MLRAGLALVRAGEPAIGAVSDTLGSGPFVLERRRRDDPIQSAMNDKGQPDGSLASAMRPDGGIKSSRGSSCSANSSYLRLVTRMLGLGPVGIRWLPTETSLEPCGSFPLHRLSSRHGVTIYKINA
jgi:hypothetical protein